MRLCLSLALVLFSVVGPASLKMKISLVKEVLLMHPNVAKVVLPAIKHFDEDCCFGSDYCMTKCLLNGFHTGRCSNGDVCSSKCICSEKQL
uniref:INVERT_DEFENSINS domain-containing protein n=1 Tax=Steinernema glaseri TaxID=37863 RepID=A0A1I7Y321_9BILA